MKLKEFEEKVNKVIEAAKANGLSVSVGYVDIPTSFDLSPPPTNFKVIPYLRIAITVEADAELE